MLFRQLKHRLRYRAKRPFSLCYGMGVDSTAMLVELARRYKRGEKHCRPDLITFADTGDEKDATYAYEDVMQSFLSRVGFPPITTVRYEPEEGKTKNGHYKTLYENCIVNKTLPSLAFGFKGCSLKWKRGPQDAYRAAWQPAIDCWGAGKKVIIAIGYDAGPADMRRQALRDDDLYTYVYPLRDWDWDRERCKEEIAAEGLPVPPKSSCVYCPAMTPEEILWLIENEPHNAMKILEMEDNAFDYLEGNMTQEQLNERYYEKLRKYEADIVALKNKINNARTKKSRGNYQKQLDKKEAKPPRRMKEGEGTKGLWRGGNKGILTEYRPGRITEFIESEGLLPVVMSGCSGNCNGCSC